MQWFLAILILPYLVLILIIYKGLLKIKPFTAASPASVKVSVVIACRNEQHNLTQLLRDLNNQEYVTSLLEIIIVDDNSSDETFNVASSFRNKFRFTVLKNTGTGKKQALRTGIRASSGELIITTDADCRAGKSWIAAIASFYERNKPDLIICPVKTKGGTGFLSRFAELEFLSLQGITAGTALLKKAIMCNGANLAFTRETYDKHSPYLHDEIVSGDDIFLLQSVKKKGGTNIAWLESEDAMVVTAIPGSLRKLLRQRKRWLSKWPAYNDPFTILVGIVTFVTIFTQAALCVASLTNIRYFPVTILVLILKSIPDYLLLKNTTSRYGSNPLMKWFIPSQLVYPFYVITVAVISLFGNKKNKLSFPSPKGT